MEQLYHLIERFVQIVFVEHKYGLGHDQKQEGMVETRIQKRPECDTKAIRAGIEICTYDM
jgi:hypothetical protein